MDNLHAEKMMIGAVDPQMNYDGSGISPETPMEQSDTPSPDDAQTFENDPAPLEETSDVSADELTQTTYAAQGDNTKHDEEQTNIRTLLYIALGVVALFFYKKK